MRCDNDNHKFVLYYGNDNELYQYNVSLPNGRYLISVVKHFSSAYAGEFPIRILITDSSETKNSNSIETLGICIPYKYDLDYIINKVKTILVFG